MLPDWSDEYSVHHEVIDEQHKTLFELAHKAYKIASNRSSPVEIKEIITQFFHYMKTHFKDEEQYMQSIGYPQLEEHRRLHRAIVAEMADAIKNIHSINVLKEMLLTITKDWLLSHILQEDMKIEQYRKEQFERQATCEVKYYYYTCACPGKEHKLRESVHLFVQNSSNPVQCKRCHQKIQFKVQE
ncbi:hemerythrin family protein [Helicobacter marmotae]|uniref:Non-heme iron protein n=1 Tax=Helicobacter marmotae TaxID=152490 RepID=A0A3D8I6K1_9HELI|nr:hemerythrin family protein [Helicobacter marmotae]RDU60768.1 non-heme iron protein [Helicobacter marmotae]